MTPGALLLKLRQTFGHGLATAYYRDIVRPRILDTHPIGDTSDQRCEIHVLTSAQDWLNLVWTLKSFYAVSERRYGLCIHDDGSLNDVATEALRHHFPAARIVPRHDADHRLSDELSAYPRCLQFRQTNLLAPKIFDFATYLETERMCLFDSDLLFFHKPDAFLRRVDDPAYGRNLFNSDFDSGYTISTQEALKHADLELQPKVNTGLGLVHPGSLRWDWIEEFLALPGVVDGHFWRIEQTLFALASSRFGVDLLPEEYTLYLERGIGNRPFRHYVGRIRHLMYREGIARLSRDGLLAPDRREGPQ